MDTRVDGYWAFQATLLMKSPGAHPRAPTVTTPGLSTAQRGKNKKKQGAWVHLFLENVSPVLQGYAGTFSGTNHTGATAAIAAAPSSPARPATTAFWATEPRTHS